MPGAMGRPREAPSPTGRGAAQDILFAGAKLFGTVGFGGTTLRAIAAEAGLRQPSLYHHFAGKHEILLTLLLGTVQPSVDTATRLLAADATPAARLWALCASDVALLTADPLNIGQLYLLPELADPRFDPFRTARTRLADAYESLIRQCDPPVETTPRQLAGLILGVVESTILQRRWSPETIDAGLPARTADAALRMLGLTSPQVTASRQAAASLLS
ncbi:TetR/AcrR family transcriptional regulator [Actinoplanes sp. NPDC051851]|uniref:TetR/AcrR family transcriptional regulator n=1 Tax=Actinoplanes sp. NPDC051851 TaxID=3154753 RepID=UPI003434EFFB